MKTVTHTSMAAGVDERWGTEWVETIEGEARDSIEVSRNAKG